MLQGRLVVDGTFVSPSCAPVVAEMAQQRVHGLGHGLAGQALDADRREESAAEEGLVGRLEQRARGQLRRRRWRR